MAGSMTYRSYVNDGGVAYSIKVDESNANAIVVAGDGTSPGVVLLPVRNANAPLLPIGAKLRYANTTLTTNPLVKRRFYFTGAASAAVLSDGAKITAQIYPTPNDTGLGTQGTFAVTSTRGEKFRKAPSFDANDTGLTDGTITQ